MGYLSFDKTKSLFGKMQSYTLPIDILKQDKLLRFS